MKNNKYEQLTQPQAKLDFHNFGSLTSMEIYQILEDFLEECGKKKLERVLIITGKGIHSKGAAIAKPVVHKCLCENKHVKQITTARRDRGGEGAFEVLLCT